MSEPQPLRFSDDHRRVPPHSIEMEMALLGACIVEGGGDTVPLCLQEKIEPQCFYKPGHRVIFQAMKELFEQQQPLDELILADYLRQNGKLDEAGGQAALVQITNFIETPAHLPHYIERVRDAFLLRELINASSSTLNEAYTGTGDIGSFLEKTEQRIFAISSSRISDTAQSLEKSVDNALTLINTLLQNRGKVTGAPTGFVDLDKLTTGWHPGEMIVVAARPSMGKTSLALNMAEAAICPKGDAPPVPTFMFSLEMPANQLAMRLLCSRARVNMSRLRDGMLSPEASRALAETAKELKQAPMTIDDSGGLAVLQLRGKARRWANSVLKKRERDERAGRPVPEVPGLVVIDYLQLIAGDNKIPREQQIAEISRNVKAMAKELGMPVVALAQLSRANERENRQPRMSDLRESGSIEQDADVVLLLSKPREYNEDEELANDAVKRDLIIAKQRNGPIGTVPLMFTKNLTRFENHSMHAE